MKTRAVAAATGRLCVAGGKTTKKANRMSNTVPKRRNAYVDVHTVLATGKDIFFAFFLILSLPLIFSFPSSAFCPKGKMKEQT